MDQLAQQESPIPCHMTTGSDVELKDVSSLLGRELYSKGLRRASKIQVQVANTVTSRIARRHQCLLDVIGRKPIKRLLAMGEYFAVDMLLRRCLREGCVT